MVKAWKWLKSAFSFGDDKAEAEVTVTHKQDEKQETTTGAPAQKPVLNFNNTGTQRLAKSTAKGGGSGFSAAAKKEVNVHIERLVDKIIVQVTNLHESTGKIKEKVSEALIAGVRDVEAAIG